MVQSMSSGALPVITYYRRQSVPHPSHAESGAFTQAATVAYSVQNNIAVDDVVPGRYRSGQGVPQHGVQI